MNLVQSSTFFVFPLGKGVALCYYMYAIMIGVIITECDVYEG